MALIKRKNSKLILDRFTGVVCAFSLRKLSKKYNGPCIRVRRSSDNGEMDIGFLGNTLNIAALLAFVGAGSGYISKWYEQSGYGNHAVQSTAGCQPLVINSGTLLTVNAKPSILFDATNDNLVISNNASLDFRNRLSISVVMAANTITGNTQRVFTQNDVTMYYGSNYFTNLESAIGSSALALGTLENRMATFDKDFPSNQVKAYKNGVLTNNATKTSGFTGNANLYLGNNDALVRPVSAYISEIIFFNRSIDGGTKDLYTSINKYCGV